MGVEDIFAKNVRIHDTVAPPTTSSTTAAPMTQSMVSVFYKALGLFNDAMQPYCICQPSASPTRKGARRPTMGATTRHPACLMHGRHAWRYLYAHVLVRGALLAGLWRFARGTTSIAAAMPWTLVHVSDGLTGTWHVLVWACLVYVCLKRLGQDLWACVYGVYMAMVPTSSALSSSSLRAAVPSPYAHLQRRWGVRSIVALPWPRVVRSMLVVVVGLLRLYQHVPHGETVLSEQPWVPMDVRLVLRRYVVMPSWYDLLCVGALAKTLGSF